MTLQVVSQDKNLLEDIAISLLEQRLIANAMISDPLTFMVLENNNLISTSQYVLKGISKSLLFSRINKWLRATYKDKMPLLYCEPIIMIDSVQTEEILAKIVAI